MDQALRDHRGHDLFYRRFYRPAPCAAFDFTLMVLETMPVMRLPAVHDRQEAFDLAIHRAENQ